MQAVEGSFESSPVEAARWYQPLASRVVQRWGAPSAAPVANNGQNQNGQYTGTGAQGSWGQTSWGQRLGVAQAPGQGVAAQVPGASTALQQGSTEDNGQYTWKPAGQASQLQTPQLQTPQLQTNTQSAATSTLSQWTPTSPTTSTTSPTTSTTSQATTTSSDTTTTHSQSTSTSTQPTTLQTRVSHKATATATDTAAMSTGTGHQAPKKLDNSAWAAVAVCAVVGLIAGLVLLSLYRKRQRAKAVARAKERMRRDEEPKSAHLERNSGLNTLPHLFLASKTALFSVVSLRSTNEKDEVCSNRSPEERQIASIHPALHGKSQDVATKDDRTPAKSHTDGSSISDASTVAGTPSRHPTFRQPTELNYDGCSSSDDSSDDEANDHRPGLYRRFTERVASIRPTRSKQQPKRGHRHCNSAPNEIIIDGITAHHRDLKQSNDSRTHFRRSTYSEHSTPCHSPGIQQSNKSNSEPRSTSDDDSDHATESPNISRSTSGDDGDHNNGFQRPPLKTRGSFKDRVTGLAKLPRIGSRNSLYKGSSAEEKDKKLSTIPDDEDNRIVASYAPATFKTYSVEMEHSPANDTQIKLGLGQSVTIFQVYDHGTLSQPRDWPRWIGAPSLPFDMADKQSPEPQKCKRGDVIPAAEERLDNIAQLLATHVAPHSFL
ncbi:hypothetical protein F9C07_2224068 [Aspergillus flavus]|uniref:Uncharacterized protein n=2 Tax=Aspergillus flavus TaxID=5059 RepID=A0A7U2MYL5_ASPFN|nr:uncharacterized protein G4B84_012212 [Aspergillus flavus NRRL3357]QMW48739.1 hypothetical protein G4B11_012257 [Aspergillus flavus]QMW36683.1 hypothetical protein G4B84_012212 [Aspergillus flavus NRRL3357]QRD92253.1 hypothetical protein F9C07_2224068 [Aspergillus flavus]RAQ62207.1 hypothetical protein COH20_002998 [Aspergillus flavus]RAQ79156.1 hypothetical protein COH21_005297 [Aspergillus flavus]